MDRIIVVDYMWFMKRNKLSENRSNNQTDNQTNLFQI